MCPTLTFKENRSLTLNNKKCKCKVDIIENGVVLFYHHAVKYLELGEKSLNDFVND